MLPAIRLIAATLLKSTLLKSTRLKSTLLIATIFFSAASADEPVRPLTDPSLGSVRSLLEQYDTDKEALQRSYSTPQSPRMDERMIGFSREWDARLQRLDFDSLSQSEKIDWLLLKNTLRHEQEQIQLQQLKEQDYAEFVPFRTQIVNLSEAKRDMLPVTPRKAAETLVEIAEAAERVRKQVQSEELTTSTVIANRAVRGLNSLRRSLDDWHRFYDGYDPLFSWWTKTPYKNAADSLNRLGDTIRDKCVGRDADALIGDPIGRDALLVELRYEMIPYTPEELLEIAESEFAWCRREMARAATDLGYDGDWNEAIEYVKNLHEEPGDQPQMIKDLAIEATTYIKENDLVTVPPLCEELWRMSMLSPERQKVSPFFLGGEVIQVSFPTDGMEHADKLMSLRGNNRHFSRATVHHELIPGHHLQGFMSSRYRTHRRQFRTPFLIEGWALHWEMLLWDRGFQRSAEDRVGMLFWRAHRCARILFSLNFHLNQMSPQECVDLLVDQVGHERANAEAEVRRSIQGNYGPLYQAAYMLGGLQMRSLHRQLVGTGQLTEREFHDAVLLENSIPLEMIRASLLGTELTADFQPSWRFYHEE